MVEEFAVRLRHDREPPERIGAVLAEALRDPDLVVAFPRLRGDEWLDPYGAPAKGPAGLRDDPRRARRRADRAAAPRSGARRGPGRARRGQRRGAPAARDRAAAGRGARATRGRARVPRAHRRRAGCRAASRRARHPRRRTATARRARADAAGRTAHARRRRRVDLGGLLDTPSAELGAAVEELRELARGVYPAVLREDGLAEALRALARRTPLPVEVAADIPLHRRRRRGGGVLPRLRGGHERRAPCRRERAHDHRRGRERAPARERGRRRRRRRGREQRLRSRGPGGSPRRARRLDARRERFRRRARAVTGYLPCGS